MHFPPSQALARSSVRLRGLLPAELCAGWRWVIVVAASLLLISAGFVLHQLTAASVDWMHVLLEPLLFAAAICLMYFVVHRPDAGLTAADAVSMQDAHRAM